MSRILGFIFGGFGQGTKDYDASSWITGAGAEWESENGGYWYLEN